VSNILYLHGFKSCGKSTKSQHLKNYFGDSIVDAPDLPYAPLEAIAYINTLLQKREYRLLIGSSLGGFYATHLAETFGLNAVLINPSTQPWSTLEPYVGWQERFCDGEIFEFKSIYLEQLKSLVTVDLKREYLVLLQSEDEVLDYQAAHTLYEKKRRVVEYGGNHRFDNITDYLGMIEGFRRTLCM
jgi:predicted esterase YcpF (UPF0227 family)